jgi:hypothetical protein
VPRTIPTLLLRLPRVFRCLCAIALLCSGVGLARAQPDAALTLEAELPPALQPCVTAAAVDASYRRALAAHGGERTAAPLRARVLSEPGAEPNSWLLQVSLFSAGHASGSRQLPVRSEDCQALPDALGLVLALLTRAAPVPQPEVAPSPQPSAADVAPPPAAPAEPAEPAEPATEHIALGGVASLFTGVLPASAFGLHLMAASPAEGPSLRLKVGLLWPQTHALAEGQIEARSYELTTEACMGVRLPSWPRLAVRLCVGPRFGLMYARGRDFGVENQAARKFLMYVGALPELALRLGGNTWLQLAAGAAVALVRPRFLVGLARGRQVVELADPAVFRSELTLSVVQIF